jgi:hypothetical protein
MRLLKYEEDGELNITTFEDNALPPYAILSHTWGPDEEEVTFQELKNGSGKAKTGYKKINFCGEQARCDGLEYFWVDTCCIDKTDQAELSWAIRSMFRWYQTAAKCYVYLADVSNKTRKADSLLTEVTWEPAFKSSRWFTRGWTLQELLAPGTVEFFSQEWEHLGNRTSLKLWIQQITGIPQKALEGTPISQFSVDDRLRWKGTRQTKYDEDAWYSLSGILDIEIAPAYGEGGECAFGRLMDERRRLERCIQDIYSTNPRIDKKRIEGTKGGLLVDSYGWVLDNTTFQQWRQNNDDRLLWVKGDPGKGKTMLLCGIIDWLQIPKSIPKTALLSYFFCQATDSRINSATAVLRGLLYMLITQQPSLVSHVFKRHDHAGRTLFEDANAWIALTEIFVDILRDPRLSTTYLIIDALDECVTDMPKLLRFIAEQSSASSCVKWVVSSRNWPDIEEQLERAGHKVRLSLELNAKSVAAAVGNYIRQKVDQLAQEKQYKTEMRQAVFKHLMSNANDTFLWVALVIQHLKTVSKRNVLKKLALFPPGLDALYERMMHQIKESEDVEICRQVLALTAVLYRPVTISELVSLVEQLEDFADDVESVREIISLCGSFLTLRKDTVYFVHQSAKDFLFKETSDTVFPEGTEDLHRMIFSNCLPILSRTLRRDMYGLQEPGYPIEDVKPPDPDPLEISRYPCIYWIDHLCDSKPKSSGKGVSDQQVISVVDRFLREKYLYWLEGLSLCKSMASGIISITKLWSLVQVWRAQAVLVYNNMS